MSDVSADPAPAEQVKTKTRKPSTTLSEKAGIVLLVSRFARLLRANLSKSTRAVSKLSAVALAAAVEQIALRIVHGAEAIAKAGLKMTVTEDHIAAAIFADPELRAIYPTMRPAAEKAKDAPGQTRAAAAKARRLAEFKEKEREIARKKKAVKEKRGAAKAAKKAAKTVAE